MTEVVSSVLFRDDVSTAGPGTTDLCGKAPNFRLDLRPLDPVSSSLQLLSPLLELDDSGIRGERCKNVVRHVHWRARIKDPIFCPITHLVSLAIADGAFEAPSLTTAGRVFEHKVWGPVVYTPLN